MDNRALRLFATVIAPFAMGYFLSYMFRAVNAVVAPNLVVDIGLSASGLGVLTAAYLLAFAVFQLPLGILLDRYGPRRVQAGLITTAGVGAVMFAIGESATTLTVARALLGLGASGGLMAAFKAVVLWYPKERHALFNSVVMAIGGFGMVTATVPAEWLVQAVGWRNMFIIAAAMSFMVAEVIFFVVPPQPTAPSRTSLKAQIQDIGRIYRDGYFWRLAPVVIFTSGSHIGIHTLWAGPWLRDIAGLGRNGVAVHLLGIALGFLLGSLATGIIADRLGRRGIDPLHAGLVATGLFMLVQLAVIFEVTTGAIFIWALFGATGQSIVLAYPKLTAHFGAALSGRAQTAMNLPLFAGAFLAQAAIGAVIDLYPVSATGGYSPQSYQTAFGALLGLQVLGMAWYFLSPARSAAE